MKREKSHALLSCLLFLVSTGMLLSLLSIHSVVQSPTASLLAGVSAALDDTTTVTTVITTTAASTIEENDTNYLSMDSSVLSTPRRRLLDGDGSNSRNNNIPLFVQSSFTVLGPSSFPKPSSVAATDALPNLQPTFGEHRSDQDAVLAFAAEYGFNTYVCFIESLRRTGYKGDIVLAISQLDLKQRDVEKYLRNQPGVVVYVINLACFNAEMEPVDSAKGGMRVCQLHELYADAQGNPLPDPREARTIATTRYELYWLWTLHYVPHTWIMLLDARDSYFQSDPFVDVPRDHEAGGDKTSGRLHFFGVRTIERHVLFRA